MTIPATVQDLPRLLQMGEKFHRMSQLPCRFDAVAFGQTLLRLMNANDKTVLVTERGMIGGAIIPSYCDPDWNMAIELFWYSEDGRGLSLLRSFERWAKDKGADEIRMSSISSLPKAERIYTKMGYLKIEESWSKC